MTDTPDAAPSGKNRPNQKGGPDAEAIVAYLLKNPNVSLHSDTIAAATGVHPTKVGHILAGRARKASVGSPESLRAFRPIEGMVRRIRPGVYYLDTKAALATTPPAPADTAATFENGTLLEVIRAYDNGRVILACEKGLLFAGSLTPVNA